MSRPELSGRHRLELAMLCDDHDAAALAADPAAVLRSALVELVRYVVAEKITPAHFGEGEQSDLNPAHLAALMVEDPGHCPPGHFLGGVLAAAGVNPPTR